MTRGRRVTFAAINIALHAPHPSEKYVELLHRAFRRREIVRMGNLHCITLGTMGRPQRYGHAQFLSGEIYRFVNIDPDQPWFNLEKKEPATEEDVEEIKIPRHLLPHLQRIPFVFNVPRHKFWHVVKDQKDALAPATAAKFLAHLLEATALQHDFPEVSVTAVPESTSVERVLTLPGLEYLKIELVRPNPDDGGDAEERWLRRLEEQRTTKAKLELFHAKNQVLEPDSETREMAEVASTNGLVYGRGRAANGLPIEDSTVERPMLKHEFVDHNIETTIDVLKRLAAN